MTCRLPEEKRNEDGEMRMTIKINRADIVEGVSFETLRAGQYFESENAIYRKLPPRGEEGSKGSKFNSVFIGETSEVRELLRYFNGNALVRVVEDIEINYSLRKD